MRTIELIGDIDIQHKLSAIAPAELPIGPVRLMVLVADELADPAQDIYTLEDGQPIDAAR